EAEGLYVLAHYRPGGTFDVVWHNENSWVFGAEPSADDSLLAMDALTLHTEAWLADVAGVCDR
ncbi:MAG: hypothetical protein AAF721_02310, partial [Myxococcota bacterium]